MFSWVGFVLTVVGFWAVVGDVWNPHPDTTAAVAFLGLSTALLLLIDKAAD